MSNYLKRVRENVVGFHGDEEGMESIQVVMILAVAGLILVVLFAFWEEIKTWVKDAIAGVTGKKSL